MADVWHLWPLSCLCTLFCRTLLLTLYTSLQLTQLGLSQIVNVGIEDRQIWTILKIIIMISVVLRPGHVFCQGTAPMQSVFKMQILCSWVELEMSTTKLRQVCHWICFPVELVPNSSHRLSNSDEEAEHLRDIMKHSEHATPNQFAKYSQCNEIPPPSTVTSVREHTSTGKRAKVFVQVRLIASQRWAYFPQSNILCYKVLQKLILNLYNFTWHRLFSL